MALHILVQGLVQAWNRFVVQAWNRFLVGTVSNHKNLDRLWVVVW